MKLNKKITLSIVTGIVGITSVTPFIVSCSQNNNQIILNNQIISKKVQPISYSLITAGLPDLLKNKDENTLKKYFEVKNPINNSSISSLTEEVLLEIINPSNFKDGSLEIKLKTKNGNIIINKVIIKFIDSNPEWPTFDVLKVGGRLGDFTVTSYFYLINDLKILNNEPIWKITNTILQNKISVLNYAKGLKIEIASGNQSEGKISLKLNGEYKGNKINNVIIDIGGYPFIDISNYLYFNKFEIDKNKFIQNLEDNESAKKWNEEKIFSYLTVFNSQDRGANKILDIKKLYNDGSLSGFIFENFNTLNGIIKISAHFKTVKYDSATSNWIEILKKVYFKGNDFKLNINDEDIVNYLYATAEVKNNIILNLYPSELYSLWQRTLDPVANYISLKENVVDKYFSNKNINLQTESLAINDLEGTLIWKSNIFSNEEIMYAKSPISKNISGFKKVNNLIVNNADNFLFINPDIDSSFYRAINRELKTKFSILDKLAINSSVNIPIEIFRNSFDEFQNKAIYSGTIPKEQNLDILTVYKNRGVQFWSDFYGNDLLSAMVAGGRTQLLSGIYISHIITSFSDGENILITRKSNDEWSLSSKLQLTFVLEGYGPSGTLSFSRELSINGVKFQRQNLS